jgi:DNA-directed RNA polymerase alpha subunit
MKIVVEAESLEELKALLEQMTGNVSAAPTQQSVSLDRFMDWSLDALPLNARTKNALRAEGFKTLDALAKADLDRLSFLPQIGNKSVEEIRGVLQTYFCNTPKS